MSAGSTSGARVRRHREAPAPVPCETALEAFEGRAKALLESLGLEIMAFQGVSRPWQGGGVEEPQRGGPRSHM